MRIVLSLALCAGSAAAAYADQPRSEIEKAIAPVLANPGETGLLIFEVADDSQASRAGFRCGDVLTHYDGQPVASLAELSRIARAAARENRTRLLVLARRGDEELESEVDAAPLGVRLLPIQKGKGRQLWHPATAYEPDFAGLRRRVSDPHEWQFIRHAEETIGWAHGYLTNRNGQLVYRVQSRVKEGELDAKRDVTVSFVADRFLSIDSMQIREGDKPVVILARQSGALTGERSGIPVNARVYQDTVCSQLAGFVATTLPATKGACLRCAYLGPGSITPAPFADLFCLGNETIAGPGRGSHSTRYELSVFGEPVASYWIDRNRDVVQIEYEGGLRAVRTRRADLLKQFPELDREFSPIEQLPPLQPSSPARAN